MGFYMFHHLLDISLNFLDRKFLGERAQDLVWSITIVLATLILKKPLSVFIARLSSNIAIKSKYKDYKGVIHNMFAKPLERLMVTVMFYIALSRLSNMLGDVVIHHIPSIRDHVSITLSDVTDHIFLFLFIVFLTRIVANLLEFIFLIRINTAGEGKNAQDMQLLPLTKEVTKLGVWVLGVFWIFGSVFHVNVPALITGLGIGGVAIALAGKETIENFFSAFTLLSDKPFKTGDYIKVGETEGTVIKIGFRSTHVIRDDGSRCIIPNQKLVSQSIINMSGRDTFGVKVIHHIRYGISAEQLRQIAAEIKAVITNKAPVMREPLVWIEGFDQETFRLSTYCKFQSPLPDNWTSLSLQQEVNLMILEVISKYALLGIPLT